MSDEQRYLPKSLKLHRVKYDLPLQQELQSAFDAHCFDISKMVPHKFFDEAKQTYQTGMVDSAYTAALLSWLSSPQAIEDSIKKNIDTLGGKENLKPEETEVTSQRSRHDSSTLMFLSREQRLPYLKPLQQKLADIHYNDNKFLQLTKIIKQHCVQDNGKVLIFVNRHLTARYVFHGLAHLLGDELSIGITVTTGEAKLDLKSSVQRIEEMKNFSPKSHNHKPTKEHSVLICTDADGVGVNLQDADTIVHYDPPDAADLLFQRVGRVLRMTTEPGRSLKIYTFIPTLFYQDATKSAVQESIAKIYNRLTTRHDNSKMILGSSVFSEDDFTEIFLDDPVDLEEVSRDGEMLPDVRGLGENSRDRHFSALEDYYLRATELSTPMLSARGYPQQQPRVVALIGHKQQYHTVVLDLLTERIEPMAHWETLNLLACDPTEPLATVSAQSIEHLTKKAVRMWCADQGILVEQVGMICGICLVPYENSQQVKRLFEITEPDANPAN